ncbi:MAG: hypothetical protein CL438_10050 [Acidimicrobiaceae bacterium]|nr:hypothetical protein [Acidimicrobiaceae bacterium]|tara:strand:- start:98 stop:361 length:264 start_codon:yes stop_codon:yes gene_type:complete
MRYFPSQHLKDIRDLTDCNNHTDAVWLLAEILGDKKGLEITKALFTIQRVYGSTPEGAIQIRNETLHRLLQISANEFKNYDQIRAAF